jgi:hypothetical protein
MKFAVTYFNFSIGTSKNRFGDIVDSLASLQTIEVCPTLFYMLS